MSGIRSFPKIDLHCHLDGSLEFGFLKKFSGIQNMEELRRKTRVSETRCNSLEQYLKKFELPVRCMCNPENLQEAAYSFIGSLVADNVCYIEVRFSPALLTSSSMNMRDVLENVLIGLRKGSKEFDIAGNVILCAMRQHTLEQNLSVFHLAEEYLGNGVCAVDLAGDEARYPTHEFRELFSYASRHKIPYTIHAGECGNADSVREAISLGASRIGHGIAMRGDLELQKMCLERNIGIEMCPSSNFQTKAVDKIQRYPIREFMNHQLCVTVNTDNRTVSNTSITKEWLLLEKKFGFSMEDFEKITRNAIACSFADEKTKNDLLLKIT